MFEHLTSSDERPTAVVVAVQFPDVSDAELASSIAELERLAKTLGLDPVGRLTQRRGSLATGNVVGEGKLKELAEWTGGTGVVPVYVKPGSRQAAARADAAEAEAEAGDDEADEAGDAEAGADEADAEADGEAGDDSADGAEAGDAEADAEVSDAEAGTEASASAAGDAEAGTEAGDDEADGEASTEASASAGGDGEASDAKTSDAKGSDTRASDAKASDAGRRGRGGRAGKRDAGDGDKPAPRATVVLVDHDLTPTQQRNLERATGVDVLDRTSVILEIFHRHARTREARLQVEIARLKYLAPRLREGGGGGDRVRGGVGGKGAGETSLELDRRRIRDRIAELRHELGQIEGGSKTRRERRSDLPTVALVGYTNAGKSSLMRALTSTEVYIADKLFATLDTTVRRLQPPTEPPILVSDTVGFIKKLPHDLVASFRSTLDEAGDADLLLHVIDASDAAHADQLAVTREVLTEIGADAVPTWLLLNKIDRVDEAGRAALAERYPGALQLSAKDPGDVIELHEKLIEQFAGKLEDAELDVPWTAQRLVHQIHERTTVLGEEHHDTGTRLKIRAPSRILSELRAALEAATAS
jgi:GTP-binding protein HflX